MKFLQNKIVLIIVFSILLILGLSSMGLAIYLHYEDRLVEETSYNEEKTIAEVEDTWKVDVKGAVNKPGVYEVFEGMSLNDVIKLANGLASNAYTDNINLSKKVEDEMVLYVYTKNEYKKKNNSNNIYKNESYVIDKNIDKLESVIKPNNNSKEEIKEDNHIISDEKININTASIDELMSLTGIGKTKANDIINHRNKYGNFFVISDLKKVKGIGDALFNKIKDNIVV